MRAFFLWQIIEVEADDNAIAIKNYGNASCEQASVTVRQAKQVRKKANARGKRVWHVHCYAASGAELDLAFDQVPVIRAYVVTITVAKTA